MSRGAIILCGGKSSRIGQDKAMLPFGNETMLERVVRIVGEVVAAKNIVVVAAEGQQLPTLLPEVRITRDRTPHQGPLAGLVEGLAPLANVDAVFVTGCDYPLLVPAFVERMFNLLDNHDIVVPEDAERCHPLAAAYHPRIAPIAVQLLEEGKRSLHQLIERVNSWRVLVELLREADPTLRSLSNINTPEEYETAKSFLP